MTSDTTSTSTDRTDDEAPDASTDAPTDAPTELGGDQAGVAPTARKARGTKTFADVGVHPDLVEALSAKGFEAPFPIQELTLPIATKGHDVIGQARTGTGKTLAFGLALLSRVTPGGGTQALVIVPTRELCLQVADELTLGQARGLRVIAVYGGVGYEEQEAAFDGGHEIVVGTPGRLLDHVNKRNLDLSGVTELVLDEADEMLDMGFLPDVERLIEACNDDRHGMLFSATMPTEVVKLARRYLDHPTFMRADAEPLETAPNVEQHFFEVHRMDKPRVLARILQSPGRGGVYVFVRTKHMADRLVRELEDLGTAAIAIHGDLRQSMREKNLDKFRDGSATVLVATEVAARGLDVENVTHVINYDCPDDDKMYLHRIGRTARAGAKGAAITFCEFNEVERLNVIRKKVGAVDQEVVAVFSPSDILTERFDLPAERPWDAQVAGSKAGTRTDRRDDSGGDRGGRGGPKGRGGRDGGDRGGRSADRGGRSGGRDDAARGGDRGGRGRDAAPADRSPRDGGRDRDARNATGATDAGTRGGRDRSTASEAPGTDAPAARTADDAGETRGEARPARRRAGQSDGRPKSSRRAEGQGNDRDADPDRRARRRGTQDPTPAAETSTPAAETSPPAAETSTAGRTRTRTRARTRSTEERGDDRAGEGRTSAARDRRPRAERERDDEGGSGGRSGGSREGRDRSERGSNDRPRARRSGERGGDRAAERGGSDDRGSSRKGAREGGRGEDRRGGSANRGGNRGRGGGRGGRDGGEQPAVPTAPRGREARGDGAPALARRVKVDHLP